MAAKRYDIDDPKNINAFLEQMKKTRSPSPSIAKATSEVTEAIPISSAPSSKADGTEPANPATSRADSGSPAVPISQVKHNADTADLSDTPPETIMEDGSDVLKVIASASTLGLKDSKYAPRVQNVDSSTPVEGHSAKTPAHRVGFSSTASVMSSGENAAASNPGKMSTEESRFAQRQGNRMAKSTGQGVRAVGSSIAEETPKPPPENHTSATATRQATVTTTPQNLNNSKILTPTCTDAAILPTPRPGQAANNEGDEGDGTEDRENLKHFKSWGTPEPRAGPAARPRTIVFKRLPEDTDIVFVSSLLYGGALETFHLSSNKTVASATFVSADACDAYYAAHSDGIIFTHAWTHVEHRISVHKGINADPISSVLQSFLDFDATRVVRATEADDDWSMRALLGIAGARHRKVESIIDVYRSEMRTILFGFTNIADAVSFRTELLRDENWETSYIGFSTDPAQTAKGMRL